LITSLSFIAAEAENKLDENFSFRQYLKVRSGVEIDIEVHALNEVVAAAIDCTACGACCASLMINVTKEYMEPLSAHLQMTTADFKETFIEESEQGQMLMNTVPCAFLKQSKCSVYAHRFEECRAFPHLDKPNFVGRIFGTLMHYGRCPIIYNVVEALKTSTGFKNNDVPGNS